MIFNFFIVSYSLQGIKASKKGRSSIVLMKKVLKFHLFSNLSYLLVMYLYFVEYSGILYLFWNMQVIAEDSHELNNKELQKKKDNEDNEVKEEEEKEEEEEEEEEKEAGRHSK